MVSIDIVPELDIVAYMLISTHLSSTTVAFVQTTFSRGMVTQFGSESGQLACYRGVAPQAIRVAIIKYSHEKPVPMNYTDFDLAALDTAGTPALPHASRVGAVPVDGAEIWYASLGEGRAVVLLHGGMGSSDNWAYLVPELVERGFNTVTIDSRGQGRSTRNDKPYSYRQMAADVRAVMDDLGLARAAVVGWSDGAVTGLVLADETPERVERLFFFACNADSSGSKPFAMTPEIGRMLAHQKREFAALSRTPADFDRVFAAVAEMQRTQPEYTAEELSRIEVPVTVVLGEHDEFIRRDHLEYLARTLPRAEFRVLPGVGHFAPLQRPGIFNAAVLEFLDSEKTSAHRITFARLFEIRQEEILAHMSDPRLAEHMPLLNSAWDEARIAAFVAAKEACWQRDGLGHWAILSDDAYVGWGGFQREGGEWDFGLVLKPDCFGLGLRITRMAISFAWADERIPFVTFLLPPSRRHLRGLERLGARFVADVEHDGACFLKYRLDTA